MSLRLGRGVSGCWSALVTARDLLNAYNWSKEAFCVSEKWVTGVVLLGHSLMIELISTLIASTNTRLFPNLCDNFVTYRTFQAKNYEETSQKFLSKAIKICESNLRKLLILFYFITNGFGTNQFSTCIFIFCSVMHLFCYLSLCL